MSIGSWDPQAAASSEHYVVELAQLKRYINLSENNQLDNLSQSLSAAEQQRHAGMMRLDKAAWAVAESLSDDDIVHLMRFFTVAEQLPGWEAQAQSPVIWLGKILKQRGTGIDKSLTLWIKAHSDNKFLPHGALL